MKLLYILFAFFISCSTEPEDCAGVAGGSAYLDDCGGCDANVNNDGYMDDCGVCDTVSTNNNTTCVQDCADIWGGLSYLDECGTCDDDVTNDNSTCELGESDCTDENDVCSYADSIQPIFDMYCTKCHGSQGGLNLTSYSGLMAGGQSGAVINDVDFSNSLLLLRITNTSNPMPPTDDSDMLDEIYTTIIAKWIQAGAISN